MTSLSSVVSTSLPPPNSNSSLPPHNIEVEQQLLGAILINNAAFYSVADIVEPDDFYEPIHAGIYSVIRSLVKTAKVANSSYLKKLPTGRPRYCRYAARKIPCATLQFRHDHR